MFAAPSGTVTFLFTDIEGSTRRWEQFPAAMAVAVARHDALIREVIEKHGGTVFKTIGDAFCAAFATASQGVGAALEAQRAIGSEEWGEVAPLRVRMALHSGVAQERDADYFGPTVNRVARILSVGAGGQTLLSAATRQLAQPDLPPEVTLQDFGPHRLKDLERAEQLFGLLAPGLPTDFPPLKSLNHRVHNLPVHPTPLIGREAEVAAILALLSEGTSRLVTLTGPGGTGKTRLSLQIGAESVDHYRDGVYFVPLAGATSTAETVAAMVQALGLKETADETPLQSLTAFLRDKAALLMLDNFEQITESAPLVASLLEGCPGLKFLVTSRIVLRLRGEREFAIPPLALPPKKLPPWSEVARFAAIELFVARAQAAKASFELTPENAAAVVEICRRLDGLPLAIELAAARIKIFAPAAMLGQLKNRLKLLTGGARDLPERQRTLRNAIAWSHDMLDEGQRALLRRLAVFQGGCSLEAAVGVVEDPDGIELDAFDGVEALVEQSLLRQEEGEEPRFAMLETIREYALEQLAESGEVEATRERHARFFLGWMQELAEQAKANSALSLESCEIEHDNLRAALDWLLEQGQGGEASDLAIALAIFWERQGHFREARDYLTRCLEPQVEVDRSRREKLLGLLGWFLYLQGNMEAAREVQEQRLGLCEAKGDASAQADALNDLALIAQEQGGAEEAQSLFRQSLELVRQTGERPRQATRLVNLGLLAIEAGEFDTAQQLLLEAGEIFASVDDLQGTAINWCNLGELALRQQQYEASEEHSQRALTLFRELKDQRGIALSLANLAEAAVQRGDFAAARPWLEEAVALAWEIEMQWLLPALLEALARCEWAANSAAAAYRALSVAAQFRALLETPRSEEEAAAVGALQTQCEAALGAEAEKIRAALARLDCAALVASALHGNNVTLDRI